MPYFETTKWIALLPVICAVDKYITYVVSIIKIYLLLYNKKYNMYRLDMLERSPEFGIMCTYLVYGELDRSEIKLIRSNQ